MSSNDSLSHPIPARARWIQRLLWIFFGFVAAVLVALAQTSAGFTKIDVATLLTVLGVALLLALPRYLLRNPWTRLGVSYAGLAGVLFYLVVDDVTIRRPVDVPTTVAVGSRESYEVVMRYSKARPLGRAFSFHATYKPVGRGEFSPKDPQWAAWLTANRVELESGWAKLEPVRAWWSELNRFDEIGDFAPPGIDPELISFQPIRELARHACAIASLEALDGNGDAALETLRPILEVSRKLEPFSRSLVRSMIGRVIQGMTLEAATFVLNTTSVSPEARTRFASGLAGGLEGEEGARRLVAVEYARSAAVLADCDLYQLATHHDSSASVRALVLPLHAITYNRRRTINLYGDLTSELQALAAHRAVSELDAGTKRIFEKHRLPLKNCAGTILLTWLTPAAYSKVIEAYWKTEDLRHALHRRLQA